VVKILGGTVRGFIYGGGTLIINNIFMDSGGIYGMDFGGIYGDSVVEINGGTIYINGDIVGTYSNETYGNTLTITGGNIQASDITAAIAALSYENTVNISGGTINATDRLSGGRGWGTIRNNNLNISGGTIIGNIYAGDSGGDASGRTVTDNCINISGSPDISSAYLYGYSQNDDHSGNALNIIPKV